MYSKSLLALVATFTIAHGTFAQEVQQVTVGDNMNYGITYSLPQTLVVATIDATCTQSVAGQYAAYAEKFLGMSDVMLEDKIHWEIQSISLESEAQADTARTFHINFSEKAALPTFYFTEDQCLWSINQKPVIEKKAVVAPVTAKASAKPVLKASDVLTGEILKAGSKAKQAELIAQEIFSIRESRSLLIKGEAENMPGDGVSLQLMLDNLTAQEEALLSLFVGTTTVTNKQFRIDYLPEKSVDRDLFFRFSQYLGLVDNDDMSGAPYYISIDITEDNRVVPVDEKAQKKSSGVLGMLGGKSSDKGIAFCIPGKARVTVSVPGKTLVDRQISMGQFGHVEQLPASQFTDKKKLSSAQFVPTTGAIKIFEQSAAQ